MYDTSLSTLDVYFFFYYSTKSFSVEVKIACNEVRSLVLLLFLPIVPQNDQLVVRADQRPAVELS